VNNQTEEDILKYLTGDFLTEIYKNKDIIKEYWIYNEKLNITLYNHPPFSNIQESMENLIAKCNEWLKENKYFLTILPMEANLITCRVSNGANNNDFLYEGQEKNENLSILKTCFNLFEVNKAK